jgi:hypothetical protein
MFLVDGRRFIVVRGESSMRFLVGCMGGSSKDYRFIVLSRSRGISLSLGGGSFVSRLPGGYIAVIFDTGLV